VSLLKQFVKYQSLGNDFIIFDWYKKPALFVQVELSGGHFSSVVQRLCDRHFGVGADGVLVITSHQEFGFPVVTIYNADGSKAESCLNGLRCVADYLFTEYYAPAPPELVEGRPVRGGRADGHEFQIKLGERMIDCIVHQEPSGTRTITTHIGSATMLGEQTVTTTAGTFSGTMVSVGNPHFFIDQQVTLEWLAQHGKAIESHELFPQKTNVEFFWQYSEPVILDVVKSYGITVFERGSGITLACSSGAAAFTGLLHSLGHIDDHEKISITMPGGSVIAWINNGIISLQATAKPVFSGLLEH